MYPRILEVSTSQDVMLYQYLWRNLHVGARRTVVKCPCSICTPDFDDGTRERYSYKSSQPPLEYELKSSDVLLFPTPHAQVLLSPRTSHNSSRLCATESG